MIFARLIRTPGANVDFLYGSPKVQDFERDIPWGEFTEQDKKKTEPWRNPPANDTGHKVSSWEGFDYHLDLEKEIPWGKGDIVDRHHNTKYGKKFYEEICKRNYAQEIMPGDALNFNLDTPISEVDDGALIRFYFDSLSYDIRCTHREPSGFRDRYDYIHEDRGAWAPIKRVYKIMNNALLTRVVDSAPIDVRNMSIGIDVDSWCWKFSGTILSRDALDAVVDLSDPVEVEANINGYKWRFIIEKWSETVTFGRNGFNISGRSTSALLAAPYAMPKSYVAISANTAQQLITAELTNTGWTFVWNLTDWLVPANVFSYSNKTTIKSIKQIIDSCGASI